MANPILSYRPKTSFGGRNEAGVALIAVLLFLILITIAGVIAVRQSAVDLKVATSDQANVLMLNASDSLLADIEQTSTPGHANYVRMLKEGEGLMGYFLTNTNDKIGDQVHLCYRPKDEHVFSLSKSRILKYGGGYDRQNTAGLQTALCNSNKTEDYTSARNTTMTQIIVRALDSETAKRFSAAPVGQDSSGNIQTPVLSIHSVSVLPSLSQASNKELTTCLGRPAGDGVDRANYGNEGKDGNVTTCLRNIGVPSSALVEDAQLKTREVGGLNQKTGKLDDSACNADAECQKALQK